MKQIILTIIFTAFAFGMQGQTMKRIVCCDTLSVNHQAATLLQRFAVAMTDKDMPIVNGVKPKKGDVVIGGTTDIATEDGFHIKNNKGILYIKSGGDKGCALGVAFLLKRYYDCDYLNRTVNNSSLSTGMYYPKQKTLTLPKLDWAESPAFRYRQTQFYGAEQDPFYRLWYGLEEPKDMFAANMWVHTFNQILPAKRFGKQHPEWYSLINGNRQPGEHSQWCLTNPAVLEAAVVQIDSIFKANPDKKMISVSQNDGNNTNCQCTECKKMEEYEGAPSGPIIYFLNKLAERFPDKEFSTLAYLFSMQPPKHIKPLPNVNIMLCDIDCKREVPLTDNESGRDFVKAIKGWARISNNIFVWDYGINFDNQVSPFPNFHVLQPNMKLFRDCHANMLFEQVNGAYGTDFSELRAYMICNLMWNPDQNANELLNTFCDRYYQEASPYIKEYLRLQKEELIKSGIDLWIYDSPISHKKGMLRPEMMAKYNELFDKAEKAIEDKGDIIRQRVKEARLSLMYSELELARTEPGGDVEVMKKKVEAFRKASAGVKSLNERNNAPGDYCDLYLKRFLPQNEKNLALGSKVTFLKAPAKRYQPIAEKALTDGLYGGSTYVESWVGWEGEDGEFIIDLEKEQEITYASCDFLHQLGAWILLPKSVSYSISTDGVNYEAFGKKFEFAEDRDLSIKYVEGFAEEKPAKKARYVKVYVETIGMCPSWHYGIGYPAWFFLDEVKVR